MHRKTLIALLILFLATTFTSSYTIKIRNPWLTEDLCIYSHQYATAAAVLYAKNWIKEGALNLRFGLIWNPKSIEFPNLKSRNIYMSFPPGAVIPSYILGKLFPNKSLVTMTMVYNLLNHFLIAFFLSITIFFFLLKNLHMTHLNATLFSLIPIFLELLLPGPLYWHQNIFFNLQAVILPFILMVFFEVIKNSSVSKNKFKAISFLQGLVFFYGTLTDWLMCLVGFSIYLKRLLNNEFGKSLKEILIKSFYFWLPLILALVLFLSQMIYFKTQHQMNCFRIYMINRFLVRTGLKSYTTLFKEYWFGHLKDWYGEVGVYLLFLSLVIFALCLTVPKLLKEIKVRKTISLIGILLIPCLLYVYILKQSSMIHDFIALIFSIPMSTVAFVLLPILTINVLKVIIYPNPNILRYIDSNKALTFIAISMLFCSFLYLYNEHPKYKKAFPKPDDFTIERFISKNTKYEDVVFSPHYNVPIDPPHKLMYSMKRVYNYSSPKEILKLIKTIQEDCFVNILVIDDKPIYDIGFIEKVKSNSDVIAQSKKAAIYKINKNDFLKLVL